MENPHTCQTRSGTSKGNQVSPQLHLVGILSKVCPHGQHKGELRSFSWWRGQWRCCSGHCCTFGQKLSTICSVKAGIISSHNEVQAICNQRLCSPGNRSSPFPPPLTCRVYWWVFSCKLPQARINWEDSLTSGMFQIRFPCEHVCLELTWLSIDVARPNSCLGGTMPWCRRFQAVGKWRKPAEHKPEWAHYMCTSLLSAPDCAIEGELLKSLPWWPQNEEPRFRIVNQINPFFSCVAFGQNIMPTEMKLEHRVRNP